MATSSVSLATTASPVVRSRVYKLLSSGFRYPDSSRFKRFQSGAFQAELWDNLSALPHLAGLAGSKEGMREKFQRAFDGVTREDFEVKFVRTFDAGDLEPPCPAYEGLHREGEDRIAIMLEVSEFYKQFGLRMNPAEGKREVPDNLCVELEFLHFLTFKEGQAREEGTPDLLKGYILAERDFLERHLAKWMPAFYEKLKKQQSVPFYADLAALTADFVNAELDLVQSILVDFAAGQA